MNIKYPFNYSETFTGGTLNKLPDSLLIKGDRRDSDLLLLLRLLSGAIRVEHISSTKLFNQKNNYFSSDLKNYSQYWGKRFPALLAEDYDATHLAEFIDDSKNKNKSFYKNILCELSYFSHYTQLGVHSTAFVFIYRSLEHISYAFPLIYASKADNFAKTYNYLKELMNGDRSQGERGFFKRFIETVYDDDLISESSIDFEIIAETEFEQNATFNILQGLCKKDMIADATDKPRKLSINYVDTGSFLVNIRNRFFHYSHEGHKNIDTTKLPDLDRFFVTLNSKLLYWLSTVLLAVISHSALEYKKIKGN